MTHTNHLRDQLTEICYEIDANDQLVAFDDEWIDSARSNQVAYLGEPSMLRRCLWDFIVDRETRMIYEMLFEKVRKKVVPVGFEYRCDTPTQRCFMQMELLPRPSGNIQLISRRVRVEERPYTPLLDPMAARSEHFVTICSWCKRLELPTKEWVEIESAVNELQILQMPLLPQLSHGICPECLNSFSSWRKPPQAD